MAKATFVVYAKGETPEEAFLHAKAQSQNIHREFPYSASMVEKNDFVFIENPSSFEGTTEEYVQKLLEEDNSPFAEENAPAGCILYSTSQEKKYTPDKVQRHHSKTTGPRKWESLYMVYAGTDEGTIEVDFSKFKDEAVKKAIAYTKEHGYSTSVVLEKRLVNQDPVVFTANMSYKETFLELKQYAFFGWANY